MRNLSTAVLRRMNREPPGFCLLSKTGIARALAWYLPDSYLCVLLDGHHKATAAALEGRPLKTLVLSTATHFNDEQQTLVFPGGECLHKTELQYHIPKLTACKTLPPSAWESFGPDKHISPSETWSEELKQSVSRYPCLLYTSDAADE